MLHKKKCNVQPNAHLQGADKYKYGKPDPPFDVFRVTDKGLLFPKYYAIDNIKDYEYTYTYKHHFITIYLWLFVKHQSTHLYVDIFTLFFLTQKWLRNHPSC